MPTDRRRLIAVVAALAVLLIAGTVWLARLVLDDTRAEFVAGTPGPATTAAPPASPGQVPATLPTDEVATGPTRTRVTDDPDTPVTETASPRATTRPGPATTTTRRPAPATTTSRTAVPPPPVPTHAIQVGGATLDNDSPRGWCAVFDNAKLDTTVTVTSVSVSGQLRVEPGDCRGDGNVEPRPACETGMRLSPGEGCFAETIATTDDAGDHAGVVRLGLRVRCTSIAAEACDVPVLRNSPPTPDRPAVLEWTDRGRDVCYQVAAPGETTDHLCSGG